jgi:hypothetical protein
VRLLYEHLFDKSIIISRKIFPKLGCTLPLSNVLINRRVSCHLSPHPGHIENEREIFQLRVAGQETSPRCTMQPQRNRLPPLIWWEPIYLEREIYSKVPIIRISSSSSSVFLLI